MKNLGHGGSLGEVPSKIDDVSKGRLGLVNFFGSRETKHHPTNIGPRILDAQKETTQSHRWHERTIRQLLSKANGVILILARIPCVLAVEINDDFSNNLFSDLAPLLTLFGEQVAKQFMASSTTWEDNILFAMGPLGILTAVVSCIRIGGPLWLRALIGRARESRAMAEEELTTSTSHDVCEIWNGQTVVRLVGSPQIIQLAFLLDANSTMPEDRLLTLEAENTSSCKFERSVRVKDSEHARNTTLPKTFIQNLKNRIFPLGAQNHTDMEARSPHDSNSKLLPSRIIPPNLVLNLRPDMMFRQKLELRLLTAFSVFLQAGVIAYSGLATYYNQMQFKKEGEIVETYAYPLTAVGTVILVLGMWICSFVIESSTTEESWEVRQTTFDDTFSEPQKSEPKSFCILWLQHEGGAATTDQQFESYAIFAKKIRTQIRTSRLSSSSIEGQPEIQAQLDPNTTSNGVGTVQHYKPCRAAKSSAIDPSNGIQVITTLGGFMSIAGFVIQITGLRLMHYSATLAQLFVTLIMVLIRAWTRRDLTMAPSAYKVPRGYEMDWLATRLAFEPHRLWSAHIETHTGGSGAVSTNGNSTTTTVSKKSSAAELAAVSGQSVDDCNCNVFDESCWKWDIESGKGTEGFNFHPLHTIQAQGRGDSMTLSGCHQAVKLRERIGQLSKWTGSVSEAAIALASAVEMVMETIFKDGKFQDMAWTMQGIRSEENDSGLIFLSVQRLNGFWKASATEIEAVLSLWLFAIRTKQLNNVSIDMHLNSDWLRQGNNSLRVSASHLLGTTHNGSAYIRDLKWYADDAYKEHVTVHSGSSKIGNTKLVFGFEEDEKLNASRTALDILPCQNGPGLVASSSKSTSIHKFVTGSEVALEKHLVQDMFSSFCWAVARKMDRLGGKTTLHPLSKSQTATTGTKDDEQWQSFYLQNDILIRLIKEIDLIAGEWLNGKDGVCLNMIPQLSANDKLPNPLAIIDYCREIALPFEATHNWKRALSVYMFLYECCKTFDAQSAMRKKATVVLFDFCYRMSEVRREREEFNVDFEAIESAKAMEKQLLDALLALERDGDQLLHNLASLYRLQGRPLVKFEDILSNEGRYDPDSPFKGFPGSTKLHQSVLDSMAILAGAKKGPAFCEPGWKESEYNAQDELGLTPIHYFVLTVSKSLWDNALRVLQRTLENSPRAQGGGLVFNINLVDLTGWSVLHCVAKDGRSHHTTTNLLSAILQLDSPARRAEDGFSQDLSGRTPFHYARSRDQLRDLVLYGGVCIGKTARDGSNALLDVVRSGAAEEVVSVLLEGGIDTKKTDGSRRTAMHWAAYYGRVNVNHKLVKKGADPSARDIMDRTPCHWTRFSTSFAQSTDLQELFREDWKSVDAGGRTVIHLAAISGEFSFPSRLWTEPIGVSLKAEITSMDKLGITPLGYAAKQGNNTVLQRLLEVRRSNVLRDPLEARPDDKEALETARKYSFKPLHLAIKAGREETVRLLLDLGASIGPPMLSLNKISSNNRDPLEVGPLTTAVLHGQRSLIPILMQRGCKRYHKDCLKALQNAVSLDDEETALLLLQEVANYFNNPKWTLEERRNGDGAWLLAEGAFLGMRDFVQKLLDYGVPIDCVFNGSRSISNCILKTQAFNDPTYEKGATALYHASRSGKLAVVELLLERGASVNKEDVKGRTALFKARAGGFDDVVELLLSHGAEEGSGQPVSSSLKQATMPERTYDP